MATKKAPKKPKPAKKPVAKKPAKAKLVEKPAKKAAKKAVAKKAQVKIPRTFTELYYTCGDGSPQHCACNVSTDTTDPKVMAELLIKTVGKDAKKATCFKARAGGGKTVVLSKTAKGWE